MQRVKTGQGGPRAWWSPHRVIYVAALTALLCLFLSTRVALRQPWLGIDFTVEERLPGLLVEKVAHGSPSELIVSPGDAVLAVNTVPAAALSLRAEDVAEDPDIFPTFAGYNAFLRRQESLAGILRAPVVELQLSDGRRVRVQPAPSRPLGSLPPSFWLLNLMGLTVFMIGAAVWTMTRRNRAAMLFFFSGAGLLITTTSMAVIVSRELALGAALLDTARGIYHLGNNVFSVFALGLLYHHPRLLARFPLTRVLVVPAVFFMVNERLQWMDLPGHTTFAQPVLYFSLGVLLSVLQWRASRGRPRDRAALRWFMMSYLGFIAFGFAIYFLPVIFTGRAMVPLAAGLGSVTLTYVGLALGVVRYRLFDVERWWFGMWTWFLAGASILAVDGLLAVTVAPQPPAALAMSLVLIGWLYFPLRQWALGKIYRGREARVERFLPQLVSDMVDPAVSDDEAWQRTLEEIFNPLSMELGPGPQAEPKLVDGGETLIVPTLDAREALRMHLADRGTRLFTPGDEALAGTLRKVARGTEDRLAAYNQGAEEERSRIMRDLHDEVGGRLLSLVHSARNPRDQHLARNAIKALRNIIYSIRPQEPVSLGEALAGWRHEVRQRCADAGVDLHWEDSSDSPDRLLAPRKMVNLSLILAESITNALAHAAPANLWVHWHGENGRLTASIHNDGKVPQGGPIHQGKGLINMRKRAEELGGSFSFSAAGDAGRFQVELVVSLGEE